MITGGRSRNEANITWESKTATCDGTLRSTLQQCFWIGMLYCKFSKYRFPCRYTLLVCVNRSCGNNKIHCAARASLMTLNIAVTFSSSSRPPITANPISAFSWFSGLPSKKVREQTASGSTLGSRTVFHDLLILLRNWFPILWNHISLKINLRYWKDASGEVKNRAKRAPRILYHKLSIDAQMTDGDHAPTG